METSVLNMSFDLERIIAYESNNYGFHVLHIYFQVYFPSFAKILDSFDHMKISEFSHLLSSDKKKKNSILSLKS